jgi:hypothetical protein
VLKSFSYRHSSSWLNLAMALSPKPVMFSFNGVIHDIRQTACFADDWRQDNISMLSTILAIINHDFCSAKTWYFLQMWQYETPSVSIINHRKSATYFKYLKSPLPLGVFPQTIKHYKIRRLIKKYDEVMREIV